MAVYTDSSWGVLSSPRWQNFKLLAGLAFLLGLFAFAYGALAVSQLWFLAPLLGFIFLLLSIPARTWGWMLAFGLLIMLFPAVILFQGI